MTYDEEKKVAEIITAMLAHIDDLKEEAKQIKLELEMQKPIYSRRKLEGDFHDAMTHLQKILNKYVELASNQSDGFWNAEEETEVRECRAFINRGLGSE